MRWGLGSLLLVMGMFAVFAGQAAAADGKAEVVFSYGGRLAISNADGTGRHTITRQGEHPDYFFDGGDGSPEFSPDGSKVTFIRHNSPFYAGGKDIMIANRDGTDAHSIRNLGRDDDYDAPFLEDPSWSPDGKTIYFVEIGQVPTSIWKINVDGSDPTKIMSERDPEVGLRFTDVDPSPDGTRLLVGAEGFRDRDGEQIARTWVLDPESGKYRLLENEASFGDWSPDGSRIVFKSVREGIGKSCDHGYCASGPRLFVMKSDGSGVHRLTREKDSSAQIDPRWSPDGLRISMTSNHNGQSEVYSVKPDGTCLAFITNGAPESYKAAWNPAATGSTAPSGCRGKGSRPVIDYPTPDFHEVNGQPRLWLGETYLGNAFTGLYDPDPDFGRSFLDYDLSYYDCLRFEYRDCDFGVDVETTSVCSALPFSFPSYEQTVFEGVSRRRGALVVFEGWRDQRGVASATVLTGGQAIFLGSGGPDSWHNEFPRSRFLMMIDHLRPIWELSPSNEKLPPAELGPHIVNLLRKVLRLRRHNSFESTAEKADVTKRTLRYQLQTAQELKRFGPLRKADSCNRSAHA